MIRGRITLEKDLIYKDLRDLSAGDVYKNIQAIIRTSLSDDSRKSNLIRAGLGSVLFGFNPLTAILGAVVGAKTPAAFDYFQQQRDKKAKRS